VPLLVWLVLLALPAASWAAAPARLTVGHLSAPVDVENLTAPLLGWQVGAGRQTAYQVQVGTTAGASDVWDSGKVGSGANSNVPYAGPALDRASGYYWRVRTWDAGGAPSDWSAAAHFGTGPGSTWPGASPIWSAPTGGSWSDYTYTGTFSITTVAASVSFRARDTGNFYLWQFRASNAPAEANMLKMHSFVNGGATVIQEVPEPFPITANTTFDFKIVTAGSTITTYLKHPSDTAWTLANSLTDTHFASGGIGFRTGSTESARFGSLRIVNGAGDTLYANDFPDGNTDFSCGTVSGGLLSVGTSKNCVYPAASGWAFLRGGVDLAAGKDVAWAHLYATGASTVPARQFVYKLSLNGRFVGVGPTQPVSSSEARYDGYDVTSLLRPGAANTLGALAYTTTGQQFEALLVVRYADGSTQTFGTGPDWKALNGGLALAPGSYSTAYFTAPQENFNAASYPFGFDTPGFDASSWPAATVKPALPTLVATPTAKVGRRLETPVSVTEYSPGNYVIDYGRTWVGGLSLDLDGTAGQVVDLRYGEVLSNPTTVKYQASAGETYEDKWTLKAGSQHLETWGLRVFRYVNVLNAPPGLTAADFTAEAYVYPFDTSLARFDSSDSNLNQVWQLSRNTIEAVNENIYVDSWERERGEYEADDYLQLLANLYTGGDSTLGTYSMQYLMANRTWPTEWPMYIIQAALDTYMQTGDVAPLAQNYATLQKKLPDRWFDPATGLIHKTTGSNGANSVTDDDIVDWPASDRDGYVFTAYNTVINAISYRSYADMAVIAAALGHSDDAAAYQAKADAIHAAVNARMWDDAAGTYRDGLQNADASPIPHDALQAGVFAVAFGLASPSRAAQVAAYIDRRGMACSVYCAAFLIQAAYAGDRPDVASGLLSSTGTNSWMHMIAQGAGATMEAWTTTEKPNTTYSHPWAASPAFNIPRSMFGIVPTSPGYDTLDIKPEPGTVAWAHITSPSVKGEIGAAFDTVGPRTDVGVWVPANAVARVLVPGVPDGTTSIYEDGAPVAGRVTDGFFAVDDVAPGCHVFTTNPGMAPYLDDRLTSVCASPVQVNRPAQAGVGGTVPATLALTLGGSGSLGSFVPGAGADYEATVPATVTSTAGDATLSVQDPGTFAPGHLVNGAYALAQPLQVAANAGAFAPLFATPTALLSYGGPVSNDDVTLRFKQAIGAHEPLRTGGYAKTLTFTLSTDTP
jgi:alpha-L-rhamnosidase